MLHYGLGRRLGTRGLGAGGVVAPGELPDIAAFNVYTAASATLAANENADTASFAASQRTNATLAATETQDVAAFNLGAGATGSLAATETADAASFAGNVRTTASLVAAEGVDTASISASASGGGGTAWAPTDLGTALYEWWDATDTSTMTFNGSNVSGWAGKKSNIVLSQASAGNQPTYASGKITFGSNQTLANASPGAGLPTGDASGELALISAASGTSTTNLLMAGGDASANYRALASTGAGNLKTSANNSNIIVTTTSLSPEKIFIWSIPAAANTTTAWIDGTSVGTATKGTFATGAPFVQVGNTAGQGTHVVRHALLMTRQLTDTERQKLEGWKSWMATGQNGAELPAGHPYKSAGPTV